ncbi:hypothetical protein [Rossellomorea vietnamensis]|uniref:hypothetical protein n=1 Tax=Rossellomorea vietnamensis TaxID=218284 RepID=UPI00077CD745|nr:hypothetical protein [Rossellomorea vietnamensis]
MAKLNEKELYYLDKPTIKAILDCSFGVTEHLKPSTKRMLEDKKFSDFVSLLLTMQDFNYRYRNQGVSQLFPLFEETIGPMEKNSDGTTLMLALGLALKELYGFRNTTLRRVLASSVT